MSKRFLIKTCVRNLVASPLAHSSTLDPLCIIARHTSSQTLNFAINDVVNRLKKKAAKFSNNDGIINDFLGLYGVIK